MTDEKSVVSDGKGTLPCGEKPQIAYADFAKLDLRVAEIVAAEKIEGSDKLLKLSIKIGGVERTLAAGIALSYSTEDVVGKKILVVANLESRKLRGVLSQGMLLAAGEDEENLSLVTLDRGMESGTKVT